jgi:predicted metalloprotease
MLAAAVAGTLLLSSCATVIAGRPRAANAANAHLDVHGDSGSVLDTEVKNALSDILDYWRHEYPALSGGRALPPLRGGLWSVDGAAVVGSKDPGAARAEACIAHDAGFVVNNGAYCARDDSIAWDRAPRHLFAQLADRYGPLMVALIFAHEMGHAISHRLGFFDRASAQIQLESQADCAAGSWAGWALRGNAPHFRDITPQKLDDALEGFLDGRDATPGTPGDVSHGNGFDRLSAVADGIDRGARYCFSDSYLSSRTFTERPFTDPSDYAAGGNAPFAEVVAPSAQNFLVADLNRFWTQAAPDLGGRFAAVRIAEAIHPPCDQGAEFGYCPGDNTVYYATGFAHDAYYSLPGIEVDESTGDVRLVSNQPADFALGVLFAIGWGLAVRHQLLGRELGSGAALRSAICYTGAYAKDVNIPADTAGRTFALSPADLDEAVSALLDQVPLPQAFGARGTTGLDRVQAFVRGYRGGLSVC